MTVLPLAIQWIASDLPRERAALAAALGVDVRLDDSIEIAGLRLEIVGASGAANGRLELAGAAPGRGAPTGSGSDRSHVAKRAPAADDTPVAAGSVARFRALGWSTVDVDRAASSWPDLHWDTAPRDSLVGARALVGRAETPADGRPDASEHVDLPSGAAAPVAGRAGSGPIAAPRRAAARADGAVTIVLLEPDTEERIAASLARHGEGPAVLYVGVPASSSTGLRRRLAGLGIRARDGTGPFGLEWAIAGLLPSSPTLVVVPDGDADEAGEPARG